MNDKYSFKPADILLPDFKDHSPEKWAVIACDQFTSEPEYWEEVRKLIGDEPSTLDLILPEVYLKDTEKLIPKINEAMKKYADDLLVSHPDSMVYIRRTQSDGRVRKGILLAIDLECYDYKKGADSLIRATEATVVERIPPRVAIRRGAPLELPHVMLLIDDPEKTVIEPLPDNEDGVLYDTPLMLGGGHIKGRLLTTEEKSRVTHALNSLTTPEAMLEKYGSAELSPLLFAVGDGNHSLASAKATYEEVKAAIGAEAAKEHPSRYALAEVVNIHDDALDFEPIYRVVFGDEPLSLLSELEKYAASLKGDAEAQTIRYIYGSTEGEITVKTPVRQLTVGTLQDLLDSYIKDHPDAEIDYIHGEDSVRGLVSRDNAIGFTFSGMGKDQLFKTVIFDGALPRKTFSMGHARDKRYYMECRKIK